MVIVQSYDQLGLNIYIYGCPKWADTKVTSRVSKIRGGGLRPLLMASLRALPQKGHGQ